jgi:hypothetical protein
MGGRQNIGAYKALASTEFIGVDKILASTKYWHQQNTGVDYWRRQNIGIDKIRASTKYGRRQNVGVDKILAWINVGVNKKLAQTQKDPLTVWLGRVHSC